MGRAAVLVPTAYSTLVLSPPIVHLNLLFLSPFTSSLLLDYSLEVGRGLSGVDDRKEALEGNQELDVLLFVRKRPLLAMLVAGGGGKGERLACPVKV